MKTITSRENPTYKDALKLLRRKYREETGLYLLEGVKPVSDALEAGIRPEKLFLRDGQLEVVGTGTGSVTEAGARNDTQDGILHVHDRDWESVFILSADLFDRLSDTEHSQGVIAVVRCAATDTGSFVESTCKGNILLLDRLQDPGNVGTLIRTAEAAGINGIIVLKGTADIYSPKVARAAAGSLFRMPVLTGLEEEKAIEVISSGGWKLAVSTVSGGRDCFEPLPEGRICLAIGNEGAGIAENLIQKAEIRLMIPMEGGIESLNAAVAAGILMYRLRDRDKQKM